MTWSRKFYFGRIQKVFSQYRLPALFVYTDGSNNGLAFVCKGKGKSFICYKNFGKIEKKQSSTWRELETFRYSLKSSKHRFKNEGVYWYTNNFASSLIVNKGCNKEKLQELALNILEITSAFNIKLSVF